MSDSSTVPSQVFQSSGETLPWANDFSLLIKSGQTPSLPTSALFDITSADPPGTSFPAGLQGSPSLSGNIVTQTVTGLTAGHKYRLVTGLTAATGTVWQAGLIIVCPY